MAEWPEYETRKRVRAAPIVNQERDDQGNVVSLRVQLPDGSLEWFRTTERGMAARGELGGYAVKYPDGFQSVNTKANFEATAVPVGDKPEHVWCAVRTNHADVIRDTLQVVVNTSIRAFTSEQAARQWANNQAETWSIVKTDLDPEIDVGTGV